MSNAFVYNDKFPNHGTSVLTVPMPQGGQSFDTERMMMVEGERIRWRDRENVDLMLRRLDIVEGRLNPIKSGGMLFRPSRLFFALFSIFPKYLRETAARRAHVLAAHGPLKEYLLGDKHLYEVTLFDGFVQIARIQVEATWLNLDGDTVVASDGFAEIRIRDVKTLGSLLTLLNFDDPFAWEASEKGYHISEWPLRAA